MSEFEKRFPKPVKPKGYTPDNQITYYQRSVGYWELQREGWLEALKCFAQKQCCLQCQKKMYDEIEELENER